LKRYGKERLKMPENLEFTDLPIQKLFQNFYVIPDYQREYVWGEKQVSQLMTDVYDEFSNNPGSEYFLGSLVVCRAKESHKYEVIDGQQRLITLSLVLNNVRRIFQKAGQKDSSINKLLYSETITEVGETIASNIIDIQYEGKEVLYDLYKERDDEKISVTMVEGLPGKTIFDAHENIYCILDTFKLGEEISRLKKFLGYFLNKVKVIQIKTPEIGNALKIFETINERGIGLDQVDLLKNLLFIQIDRSDFSKLKREWGKFKKSIVGQKEKEKPLRFLRYFIMANYEIAKDKRGSRIVREDDIYEWFNHNENKCNYKTDSFGFVRRIQENAAFYMDLIRRRYSDEVNVKIDNIFKLVGSAFKQHLILLLAAKNLKPEHFNHLLRQLEVLLFYYNITREPPRDIERRFADWAPEIRAINTKKLLNEFISNRIKADIDGRSRTYETSFRDLRATSMQKYKLKYILGKIAQFIEMERLGETEAASLDPYVKKSIHIEHILPENPTEEILQDFSNGDKEKYNDHVQMLGNLTLLERPINTSLKRAFFPEKCEKYKQSNIYLTRSIAHLDQIGTDTSVDRLTEYLWSFSVWDKDSIDKRHNMLYELSKRVWKIDIFNE
jgi:uncharacterized protein with ParB-like and HNH nuclease domain